MTHHVLKIVCSDEVSLSPVGQYLDEGVLALGRGDGVLNDGEEQQQPDEADDDEVLGCGNERVVYRRLRQRIAVAARRLERVGVVLARAPELRRWRSVMVP